MVANFLFGFGTSGIAMYDELKDVNINDANSVEMAYMRYPNNVYLAAMLQSHALIKWSDNLK